MLLRYFILIKSKHHLVNNYCINFAAAYNKTILCSCAIQIDDIYEMFSFNMVTYTACIFHKL